MLIQNEQWFAAVTFTCNYAVQFDVNQDIEEIYLLRKFAAFVCSHTPRPKCFMQIFKIYQGECLLHQNVSVVQMFISKR